ncbi:MAG: ubiquinol-cytochrome c reductase iron-sulfur subunit [Candidatus Heimdallarchaeota archaeon]
MKKIRSKENEQPPTSDILREKRSTMTRRMLLKAGIGALALTPFGFSLLAEPRAPQEFKIERHAIYPIPEENRATFFIYHATKAYVGEPAQLINLGDPTIGLDGYIAFIVRCTHYACVAYFKTREEIERLRIGTGFQWPGWTDDLPGAIYCACHAGGFSPLDGSVLGGPPPKPIPEITIEWEDDNIYATGIKT